MLSKLRVENFALVESVEVAFDAGFNALTGETGSGKSLLIGALEAVFGARIGADAVREGSKVAVIEATIESPFPIGLKELVTDELGLEWDGAEPLTLRREIGSQGRSRCMIAGQLVNVGDLKLAGELLADLHGQHEHQSLFHASAQRAALDAFADHDALLAKYRAKFEAMQSLKKRRDELATEAADFEKRMDFLSFQIGELESANPRGDELDELAAEERRLAHAETLARAANEAYSALYEGERDDSKTVVALLGEISRALMQIAKHDPTREGWVTRLTEIETLTQDLAAELRDYAATCEADPKRLDAVVERSELLRRLIRKHGVNAETELPAFLAGLREERDRMEHDDRERGEIGTKLEKAQADAREAAAKLSKSRATAAKKLSAEVTATLAQVAMEKAEFKIALNPLAELSADGADAVEFLLAANVGEGTHPLRETASGGELSRAMLAIKTALAARDGVPTLVFDEIDAGISGQTAARVGKLMESLARARQVICITHHASIAARAGRHLSVSKSEKDGRTRVTVATLDSESRLGELAGLMGGDSQNAAGRKLAKQLME